jgi:inner membrane protein
MMALTHSAIAAAAVGFSLGTTDPLVMGMAILGSQLPDLDTSTSLIGQICFPVSRWLEARFPHRTLTHCFLATGAIALVSFLLWRSGLDWKAAAALPIGHLVSCFADTFTKQGVQLFFPAPAWCVFGSNPNRRLTTGGVGEYWVLAGAIALVALNIHLTGSGGIVRVAGQSLGLKSEAISTYNQSAASQQVWAEVKGVFTSDRTRADGKYFVIDAVGSDFIISDEKAIYQTGQQIAIEKLTISPGDKAQTQIQTLTFDDEEAVPTLQQIRSQSDSAGVSQFPDAAIFITGDLQIDFPEDVELPVVTGYPTAAVTGSTLKLSYRVFPRATDTHPPARWLLERNPDVPKVRQAVRRFLPT